MRRTTVALVAVLASASAAFAGSAHTPKTQAPAVACIDAKTGVKLDCGSTGSLQKATDTSAATGKGPRLGIDVNPWFVPGAF